MQDNKSIQAIREEYIKKLDATSDVRVVENLSDDLFALDLTLYSKNYNFNSIIYNALSTSHLDARISLHPYQQEILNIIENNSACIISAPTSFGKTFCLFEHIYKVKPQTVVLIVPTLALIDEYKRKFIKMYKDKFLDYKIYTTISKDKEYDLNKKNIFILTHDKIVQDNTYEIFKNIDFLAIDEVYKLEKKDNDDRVLILNMAYYYLSLIAKKYVLLAPFIESVENTEVLDKKLVFYKSDYSPVVNNVVEREIINDKYRFSEANRINKELPSEEKTLIYFGTVYNLNKYIVEIIVNEPIINNIEPEIKNFIEWAENEIHEEWSLIKALERGYLVHNGQIPLGIRMFQLNCYENNKNYNRLLCTSTLLEGVNTTAKNIIIVEPSRMYNENFTAFDFFNLVGRTGRLFKHFIGNAYYIKGPSDTTYSKNDAKKSIEFEITTDSEDINFQKQEYDKCNKILNFIKFLNISIDDYKENIGTKLRYNTVIDLYNSYVKHKERLLKGIEAYNQSLIAKQPISRRSIIEPLYFICEDSKIRTEYSASLEACCINALINKTRPKIKDCIIKVQNSFKKEPVNSLISKLIKYKNSYIEHQFYKKVSIILFFMTIDNINIEQINTIRTEVLNIIDLLYYANSPSKKLLYDMGIYEKDIDIIIKAIGEDFDDINDLKYKIQQNIIKISNRISYISKYIINNLLQI